MFFTEFTLIVLRLEIDTTEFIISINLGKLSKPRHEYRTEFGHWSF